MKVLNANGNDIVVNEEALETFWYWINQRHLIYLRKESGTPKPWTDDPILQSWRFCNVFRKLDRQTRYLLEYIEEYENEDEHESPGNILFNIFLFRAFNLNETYEIFGWVTGEHDWDEEIAISCLKKHVEAGNQLTSGAYMIRGREDMPKYESICKTLTDIWHDRDKLAKHAINHNSLELIHTEMMASKYWGWGPFTNYQVCLDLTYTPILPNPVDINSWCEFGPGAQRGISLIFPGIRRDKMITGAEFLLETQGMYLKDYMPIMTLQDIEFCLCELQKYWRIKNGGKAKERYPGGR